MPFASKYLNSFPLRVRCLQNSSQSTWIRICIVLSMVTFLYQRKFVRLHFSPHRALTRGLVQLLELPWDHSKLSQLSALHFAHDFFQFSTQVSTVVTERTVSHQHSPGSGRVGKIVAAAAAKHLTPVSLEVCCHDASNVKRS